MRHPMTKAEARAYLDRVSAARREDGWDAHDCTYGHFDCAATHRGPCSDEVRGAFNLHDYDPED